MNRLYLQLRFNTTEALAIAANQTLAVLGPSPSSASFLPVSLVYSLGVLTGVDVSMQDQDKVEEVALNRLRQTSPSLRNATVVSVIQYRYRTAPQQVVKLPPVQAHLNATRVSAFSRMVSFTSTYIHWAASSMDADWSSMFSPSWSERDALNWLTDYRLAKPNSTFLSGTPGAGGLSSSGSGSAADGDDTESPISAMGGAMKMSARIESEHETLSLIQVCCNSLQIAYPSS